MNIQQTRRQPLAIGIVYGGAFRRGQPTTERGDFACLNGNIANPARTAMAVEYLGVTNDQIPLHYRYLLLFFRQALLCACIPRHGSYRWRQHHRQHDHAGKSDTADQ